MEGGKLDKTSKPRKVPFPSFLPILARSSLTCLREGGEETSFPGVTSTTSKLSLRKYHSVSLSLSLESEIQYDKTKYRTQPGRIENIILKPETRGLSN